jgi:hypothetical protein
MPENTLIGRCTVAYAEAFEAAITSPANPPNSRRAGIRAVIEHLAAELMVMHQCNEGRLSAHDAAQQLLELIKPAPSP